MAFGVDFETNIGNRHFNVINYHCLYLGEATQKIVLRLRKSSVGRWENSIDSYRDKIQV